MVVSIAGTVGMMIMMCVGVMKEVKVRRRGKGRTRAV
jgi:hypothetical protein